MRAHLIFKGLLIAAAVFSINLNGFAQTDVEKLKVGFITKGLDLDSAEAEKFWPVYNKYQKLLKQHHNKKQNGDMSADEQMELEIELLKIKKEKLKDLKIVLPNEKVSKYYKIEADFKQGILKKLNENNN